MPDKSDVTVFRNIENVIEFARTNDILIAGGEQIYSIFMPYITVLYITTVFKDVEGDTFFPKYGDKFIKSEVIMIRPEFEIAKWVRR
jgi:dihydrofolate reductase